eukprot:jgi/Galph1/4436/GphlegSOOS_G3089.1
MSTGSSTFHNITTTQTTTEGQEDHILRLELARRPKKKVRWTPDTHDNERENRRKSKICCIFHKRRRPDDSCSSSSSDSDTSTSEEENSWKGESSSDKETRGLEVTDTSQASD